MMRACKAKVSRAALNRTPHRFGDAGKALGLQTRVKIARNLQHQRRPLVSECGIKLHRMGAGFDLGERGRAAPRTIAQ